MPTIKRITKSIVDAMTKGDLVNDKVVQGFYVRHQGRKPVYGLRLRIKGTEHWIKIGEHGAPWTPETARAEAQRIWGDVRRGVDIVAIREAGRDQPTVSDLCDRFLAYSKDHNKPKTYDAYQRNVDNHIRPLLGKYRVMEVAQRHIEEFKEKVRNGKTAKKTLTKREGGTGGLNVTGGPGCANRCLAALSKMFNLAEMYGWRQKHTNPVEFVERFPERKMDRYLTSEEYARIGEALAALEAEGRVSEFAAAAVRLLIFTGARLNEILTLKWSYVDLQRRLLLLPDSKTGAKAVVLNDPAIEVLAGLKKVKNNPWVIIGKKDGKHLYRLQDVWDLIRTRADVQDVRIHDLRHSFASFAVLEGGTLPVLGSLLGHAAPATTARYVHLAKGPISALADATGAAISRALKGG